MLSIFKIFTLYFGTFIGFKIDSLGVSLSRLLSRVKNCPSFSQDNFQLVEVTYQPIFFFFILFHFISKNIYIGEGFRYRVFQIFLTTPPLNLLALGRDLKSKKGPIFQNLLPTNCYSVWHILSFEHTNWYLYCIFLFKTSVNLVHNAPVELPPARSFLARPSPPPISQVIIVTENKTHQKKKKNKGPGSLTETEKKTQKKKKKKK